MAAAHSTAEASTATSSGVYWCPRRALERTYLHFCIRLLKLLGQLWRIISSRHQEACSILFEFQVHPALFYQRTDPCEADARPDASLLKSRPLLWSRTHVCCCYCLADRSSCPRLKGHAQTELDARMGHMDRGESQPVFVLRSWILSLDDYETVFNGTWQRRAQWCVVSEIRSHTLLLTRDVQHRRKWGACLYSITLS